jgi:hypothetical protein
MIDVSPDGSGLVVETATPGPDPVTMAGGSCGGHAELNFASNPNGGPIAAYEAEAAARFR